MISQRTRIAALIAGCGVAAGGAYAATDALSSPAPAAATSPAQPTGASPGQSAGASPGQSAGAQSAGSALSSAISDAASSPDTAPATAPADDKAGQRDARGRLRRSAIARLRRVGGEHGEFTFRTKKGTRTVAFERGTIESVSGTDVTVRAADGTTWTWVLTSTSVVREDGSRSSSSALAAGERVFAGGPVTGAAHDARLIVIRKATSGKSAKSATSSVS